MVLKSLIDSFKHNINPLTYIKSNLNEIRFCYCLDLFQSIRECDNTETMKIHALSNKSYLNQYVYYVFAPL